MKNIEENNKIIANFLNWEIKNIGKGDFYKLDNLIKSNIPNYEVYYIELENQGCILEEDLCFHNDWNWLMPVVEKIESIYDDFHGYFAVYICGNDCTIQGTNLKPGVVNAYFLQYTLSSKLESTYQAVITFINWYNEQNKNYENKNNKN